MPLEFIDIGISNQGIVTVSDTKDNFSLMFDAKYNSDTIFFSYIGYNSYSVKDMGYGQIYFTYPPYEKVFYQKISQAKWESYLLGGISISVDALAEK
jgi:hypothetical protein